ncbi:MAG: YigZ family protein [Butyrivibrio sp.]|nr:YigZ family protein [Butyrivibrio sp.]
MSEHIIVKKGGESEYEEKKSRFLGKVFSVNSEAEASAYIEEIRKKYWDARHNCYAFVIGENNETTRCSDDREPSGTAGKPILEVICNAGVHNCLLVVTRYFGGTLLGTGGLVRAYTQSAKEALENSALAVLVEGVKYLVTTDYNSISKIQYAVEKSDAEITDTEYTDKVIISILIKKESGEEFCRQITEITNGRAIIEKECDLPIEISV